MAEIIRIDKSNLIHFRSFLTEEKCSLIGSDDVIAVGAVDDTAPVGVVLVRLTSVDSCHLIWMFIEKEHRRRGIAGQIWDVLTRVLSDNGIRRIIFAATDEDRLNGMWDFISEKGGRVKKGEYIIPTTSAMVAKIKLRAYEKHAKLDTLEHVSTGMYVDALNRLGKKSTLYKIRPELWADSEEIRKFSFGIINGTVIESFILCVPRDDRDGLVVFDMGCSKQSDALYLLERVASKSMALYGSKAFITLGMMNGVEKKLSDFYGGQDSCVRLYPCEVVLG